MEDKPLEQMVPLASLRGIKFSFMLAEDMEKFSVIDITEASDVTSSKLGLPNASLQCGTCGSKNIKECEGHNGIIRLPATIYHPYYVSEIVQILNRICPGCKSVKQERRIKDSFTMDPSEKNMREGSYNLERFYKILSRNDQRMFLKLLKSKFSLPTRTSAVRGMKFDATYLKKCSKIQKTRRTSVSKNSGCKYCSRSSTKWYPALKFKSSSEGISGNKSISIVAEINEKIPKRFQNKSLSEVFPTDYWNFVPTYPHQRGSCVKKLSLSPSQVFHILKQLDKGFIEQFVPERELLFLSCLPVTPNCHRVTETSHVYADGPQLSYDERTKACRRVVDISKKLSGYRHHEKFGVLAPSYTASRVLEYLKTSKLWKNQTSSSSTSGMEWLKDVVLSKRSDNGFRTVMVGDPKIRLNEIGLPRDLAENLYISENVNDYNLKNLNLICNLHLLRKDELHVMRKGQLASVRKSNQLKTNDVFYRPLRDGDAILINRNPSVHQHSLIGMSVKILPIESVVSINPLLCAPLLGDFDGDCLHGFISQSVRSRIELSELVSLENQLLNAQDGRSLLSLTHDSLTAAHLITATSVFLNKFEMQQLAMTCSRTPPVPAIIKSSTSQRPLWTGEQLFSMLLPTSMDFDVGWGLNKILVSRGEVLTSPGSSFWLQNNCSSIFSSMFKRCERKSLNFLFSAQDVLCEYLTMRGFSVSLSDVYLSPDSRSRTKLIDEVSCGLREAESVCRTKQLMTDPELEFILKALDESDDSSEFVSQNIEQRSVPISKVSVAAFKEVFHDLQCAVIQYASKENSMLSMINAGSKGSFRKLVEQGACLGLQFSGTPLPFKMPRELSCAMWNQHKALDQFYVPRGDAKCPEAQDFYAVIKSSFLDGLNPLECLVHSISCRGNLFSENAAVPGTLTRKLMFYMRDLYAAYDGTVRNAYGQQIVQFSYDLQKETSVKDGESLEGPDEDITGNSGLGGQPVGSWAACSLSEAAYGAVDQPCTSLEDSPLMNIKKVFDCGRPRKYMDRTVSLFLSKKLERWAYGYEYGALEVKTHLEKVSFSDVVTSVMIFYAGREVQGTKFTPWISHFHLSKERMMRKRLKVQHIIDELSENYNSVRAKADEILPRLCIINKVCSSVDLEKEKDDTVCITVSVETSESNISLDFIRDMLIPLLLRTKIKGFVEFKKVDILCDAQDDHHAGLFLKVTLSENCPLEKFWGILQDACIPIMDLIDWDCSHPNSIYDIFSVFGIDVAWMYFLKSLKMAASDTGRNIRREHLVMVANRLSVTGEFHGLTSKGLQQQIDHASISAPFLQACFVNPRKNFINAAKQGSMDKLFGTVDAMAWGKEAPIGTGGSFDIIYSGKIYTPEKLDNIYETVGIDKLQQNPMETSIPSCQNICNKRKGQLLDVNGHSTPWQLISNDQKKKQYARKWENRTKGQMLFPSSSRDKEHRSLGFKSNSFSHKFRSSDEVVDMHSSLRAILHCYQINEYLNEVDKLSVMDALVYHPKGDAKRGIGIQDIKVGQSPTHQGSRCFILIRDDGTSEDFSYRKCVVGYAKKISPEAGSIVERELTHRR